MNVVQDWKSRKLTDLAEYINGYAFKPEDWGKHGLPIIRIEQLKNPDSISDYYSGCLPEHNIIDNGDLIFSWSASLFLSIWKDGKAALNQHLFKVVEKEGVDRHFLKQFIEFYLPEMMKVSHGSTMQHLTRKELDRFRAVFPCNRFEQSKIAEILSTVDQAIEQTEALIAKQQRIKTGLMQDLLTRGIDENGNLRSEETHEFKDSPLGRIPVGWEVKTIGNLAAQVTKGESPTWQGFKYHEEGILFITSENVRAGFLDITKSEKFISDTFHKKLKRSALRYGDILVNLVGASIARSAVYDLDRDANINQAVCSVRLSNEVKPLWLCEYLQLSKNIERLLGEQVETARANLSLGDIRSYLVPYPPPAEQSKVIMQIDLLRNEYEYQVGSLTKLRSLKTALMQDLLTGKVSVAPLLTDAEGGA